MRLSQETTQSRNSGILVLADGSIFRGEGLGAAGAVAGEICFNTAMTGYQEIMTDPSYAGQVITFTFPHIGNTGVNPEDVEDASPAAATAAVGAIFRAPVTAPSNYRSHMNLPDWMKRRRIIGLAGIDTRALTARIREQGMPHGVIAHNPSGQFDMAALQEMAKAWAGLEGRDLAKDVTTSRNFTNDQSVWQWGKGFPPAPETSRAPHVVVIDYGVKQNILHCLAEAGCRASVVSAQASFEEIMDLAPDGVVLSNGPGDPAATGHYAVPVIRALIEAKMPLFGICLGHQLLALAAGAKTVKMAQGHHGANHPVKDLTTGKVEIVSMNHGFAVDETSLPANAEATHISLFDGSNCGLRLKDAPAFSVQHHPEASPGPQDSFYIFQRFADLIGEETPSGH